ncbi:MAG: glycosyltransferase [Chlamydiota bacterium]|nr:glycosyltransferase [Chlamydiota bacterium]
MKLPISVIIPLTKSREPFFYNYCLPSVEANNPQQIIIEDDEGSAPYKRNLGASKATQPYLFFCDDDTILSKNCLPKMFQAIHAKEEVFAYSHYAVIVTKEEAHPIGKNFIHQSKPFNAKALQKNNYIDTMSLLKTQSFPGFDENLLGYQDWDLWLRVVNSGGTGAFIDDLLFMKFCFDKGISSDRIRHREAKEAVRSKHQLAL